MDIKISLANRLKEAAEHSIFSKNQIAKELGVSDKTLYNYLNSDDKDNPITFYQTIKLCEIIDVTFDVAFGYPVNCKTMEYIGIDMSPIEPFIDEKDGSIKCKIVESIPKCFYSMHEYEKIKKELEDIKSSYIDLSIKYQGIISNNQIQSNNATINGDNNHGAGVNSIKIQSLEKECLEECKFLRKEILFLGREINSLKSALKASEDLIKAKDEIIEMLKRK